jgi:matrixin
MEGVRFSFGSSFRPCRAGFPSRLSLAVGMLALGLPACLYYDSSWGQAKTAQQNAAQHYSGARLGEGAAPGTRLPPRQSGELRRLKLVAVATRDHAVQVVGWQGRFREAVERANPLLGPALGVELEVVDGGIWRPAGDPEALDTLLTDLERNHDGQGADYVVGLVGALDRLEPSIHQLGVARLHGKHMVLRAANDALEYDAITEGFGELSREDRDELYRSRRAHRASAVLIHELGHCLGAVHVQTPSELMYARYGTEMSALSEPVAAVMRITLAERALAPEERDGRRMADRLLAELGRRRAPWVESEQSEMEAYLASLTRAAGGAPSASSTSAAPGAPTPAAPTASAATVPPAATAVPSAVAAPDGLSPAEQELYARVLRYKGAGQVAEAWGAGQPLFKAHSDNQPIAELRCQLAMDQKLDWEQTRSECEPLMKLSSGFSR